MDRIAQYRTILKKLLENYIAQSASNRSSTNEAFILIDKDENHFQWMHTGWREPYPMYGCVMHFEIKNNKIWVHQDNTDLDPVGALLEAGIPESDIVLAFHAPSIRIHTGFAVG
jgi:hypothetical protein